MTTIERNQRHTRSNPCLICGGYNLSREGQRCWGFRSEDGKFETCTRLEFAGNLEKNNAGYTHILQGPCKCGKQHGPDTESNPRRQRQDEPDQIFYSYHDEKGRLAYQVERRPDKAFPQRRPENGKWTYNMKGIKRLPYRLPELLKAPVDATVYIAEGEKDVDNLAARGFVATTNSGGAGNWQESCSPYLKDRRVVILPDNDDKGREHAKKVAKALQGTARDVRIVELPNLPEKGDVSDWFSSGGTHDQLEAICKPPKRKFTYASEVQEQPIEWVWENRIAKGCFTLAVGDAGVGKGLTLMAMMRSVTRGQGLPGDGNTLPGGVILMSPEDPASQVLIPRMKAAGVDLTKVLLLSEVDEIDMDTGETYQRPVSFPEDAHILREAIEDAGAVLVIIDPVLSMLSGKVDAHKNHAVRQALAQVISTANKHNAAVLGVMHTTKTQHPNVLFRSSSSSAFVELARTALFFVPDPDGEQGESGVIVNYKNNLSSYGSSIRYAIHSSDRNVGYITWEGESSHTRDDLLNQAASENSTKSAQETDILAVLKENSIAMTVSQIQAKIQNGQSFDALDRMLLRKIGQGVLIKPARGLYTYKGNPLYTPETEDKTMSGMSEMSDVGNVGFTNEGKSFRHEPDNVGNKNSNGHRPQAPLPETDISDIEMQQETMSFSPAPYNSGPKTAQEAAQYLRKWVDSPYGTGQIVRVNSMSVEIDVMGKTHHLTGSQIPQIRVRR